MDGDHAEDRGRRHGAVSVSRSEEQWLDLREAADARARNGTISEAMRAWFLQRHEIIVADLSGDLGANLRATAPLLPARQRWRLFRCGEELIAAARARLAAWADTAVERGGELHLAKGGVSIEVSFAVTGAADRFDAAFGEGMRADLVTASAAFGTAPPKLIRRFAAVADRVRAAVYVTLTGNGLIGWTPRHPSDRELLAAFHRFQMRDSGLGPAAGPTAAVELAEALTAQGFSVTEGASAWRLKATDAPLVAALMQMFADGAGQGGTVAKRDVEAWLKRPKSGAEVGHIDLFATPPAGKGADMSADD